MRARTYGVWVLTLLLSLGAWSSELGGLVLHLNGTLLQSYDPGYYWMKSDDFVYRVKSSQEGVQQSTQLEFDVDPKMISGKWGLPSSKRESTLATSPKGDAIFRAGGEKLLIRGTSVPSYFGKDHGIRVGNVIFALSESWLSAPDRSRMDMSSGPVELVVDRRAIVSAHQVPNLERVGPVRSPASVLDLIYRSGDRWTIRGVVMPGFDGRSYTLQVGNQFVRIDSRELAVKQVQVLAQTGRRVEVTIPSRAVEYTWGS